MRLTHLQAAEDAQARKPFPARLDRRQVPVRVEARRGQLPGRIGQRGETVGRILTLEATVNTVVAMFGEGDPRQPEGDRLLARALRRPDRRIPGPLAMHMAVGGQHHKRILPD